MKLAVLIALASASIVAIPASAAPLVGDTVTCSRNAVDCSDVSMAVVGPAVEFTRNAGTFDFDASGVTFTEGDVSNNIFANPLVYAFTDSTNPFTSAMVTSYGNSGLTADTISFANGTLSFNLNGQPNVVGSVVRVALTTAAVAAVPEINTWAMMILGMGAIGFAMRSAKRRSDEKFDAKIKRITEGAIA